MKKDGRLNHAEFFAVIDLICTLPRLAEIVSTLEMDSPAVVFCAGRAEQGAVVEFDRLILDWAKYAVRQTPRLAPVLSTIVRSHHHSPPLPGAGADFVKERQRP